MYGAYVVFRRQRAGEVLLIRAIFQLVPEQHAGIIQAEHAVKINARLPDGDGYPAADDLPEDKIFIQLHGILLFGVCPGASSRS